MAHTYTNLLAHVVFSTQGHLPLITKEIKAELYAYMAALIKEKGGKPIILNGIEDHIRLLFELPPNIALSDLMRFMKANSSRWMKERFGKPFASQKGFGASAYLGQVWTRWQNTSVIRRATTRDAIFGRNSRLCYARMA